MPLKSTRFSIVEQAIADSLERLRELPVTPRVRELKTRALGHDRDLRRWSTTPPSEEERDRLTKKVIELNVEVMTLLQQLRGK